MFENIFAGILTAIAIAAAAFGWWLENGSSSTDKTENSNTDKE